MCWFYYDLLYLVLFWEVVLFVVGDEWKNLDLVFLFYIIVMIYFKVSLFIKLSIVFEVCFIKKKEIFVVFFFFWYFYKEFEFRVLCVVENLRKVLGVFCWVVIGIVVFIGELK